MALLRATVAAATPEAVEFFAHGEMLAPEPLGLSDSVSVSQKSAGIPRTRNPAQMNTPLAPKRHDIHSARRCSRAGLSICMFGA